MKNKIIISATCVVVLFTTAIATHAQVIIFADNFESGNLNKWVGRPGEAHHGVIVPDPLNPANKVLTFNAVAFGGDMFGAVPGPVDPTKQHLTISFDFLALPVVTSPANNGGFVGINPDLLAPGPFWLAGTIQSEL